MVSVLRLVEFCVVACSRKTNNCMFFVSKDFWWLHISVIFKESLPMTGPVRWLGILTFYSPLDASFLMVDPSSGRLVTVVMASVAFFQALALTFGSSVRFIVSMFDVLFIASHFFRSHRFCEDIICSFDFWSEILYSVGGTTSTHCS